MTNAHTHNVKKLAHEITTKLKEHLDVPDEHAWWMLEALTKKSKAELLLQEIIELTHKQATTLALWIEKQTLHHEPLQYLIGSVPFCDLEILVAPPILIPRPETEEWCCTVIEQIKKSTLPKITILDLCTGSGCIACALAQALPHSTIYATDINPAALELAQKNAQHNNLTNIQFLRSDLFNAIPAALRFDMIVGNPPYIAPEAFEHLAPTVKNFEDVRALVAQDHGLEIIKKIIITAPEFLKNNSTKGKFPSLALEIGYDQGKAVATLMQSRGFTNVTVHQDFAGNDRLVTGSWQ